MPTAAEYERYAREFDQLRRDTEETYRPLTTFPLADALVGGPLAHDVATLLDDLDADARRWAAECDRLGDTCRWRAAVCRAYDDELTRWHRTVGWLESEGLGHEAPRRPRRRYPWIDTTRRRG